MEVVESSALEFDQMMGPAYHVFGSAAFAALNQDKAEAVYYLLFKDSKYRLGLTLGIREGQALSPFSAPFGGFVAIRDDIKIYQLEEALAALVAWAKAKAFKGLQVSLPPAMYKPSFIAKQVNVFFRAGFSLQKLDLNYAFPSALLGENYLELIWRNARKNLKVAQSKDLQFSLCQSPARQEAAFAVISQNRRERGFPLRMTWAQVQETIEVIEADFFICETAAGEAIAAAMVFHVAPAMVQVIYWGDLPQYAALKTMNFLSYALFQYYQKQGIAMIDIGPSTENSIPNHGLCEFKESIGCEIEPKYSFGQQFE